MVEREGDHARGGARGARRWCRVPASRPASPSFLRSRRIRSRTSTGSALGEAALRRRERGSKAASPSTRYPAVSRDPGLGQAVAACCFGLGQALRGDGGDDQPGSRPHRRFAGPEVLPMSRDMCCSCPEPAHFPRYNCDVSGIGDTRTCECRSGCCSFRGFAAGSLRGSGGLVVAAGFEGVGSRRSSPVAALMTRV